jgi:hypothetical protein
MHAVVVKVTVGDFETAQQTLRAEVVPRASAMPGFVAGYWTRPDEGNRGLAMLVFESEETARAAADVVRQAPPPPTVSIESAEVREVVAHA